MSQEGLENLRRGYAAFSRGDPSDAMAVLAEDVDWGTTGAFAGIEAAYRGQGAVESWMEVIRSAWTWFEVLLDEVVASSDDMVVVVERLRGRGRESGAEVETSAFCVYWFEEGKVVKRRAFLEKPQALEAAGLSE